MVPDTDGLLVAFVLSPGAASVVEATGGLWRPEVGRVDAGPAGGRLGASELGGVVPALATGVGVPAWPPVAAGPFACQRPGRPATARAAPADAMAAVVTIAARRRRCGRGGSSDKAVVG